MSIKTTPRRDLSTAATELKSSSSFREVIAALEAMLAEERQLYETTEASEFKRGRVCILNELLTTIRG